VLRPLKAPPRPHKFLLDADGSRKERGHEV
jgi:hypothetical protein